jgi:hypothetical protein
MSGKWQPETALLADEKQREAQNVFQSFPSREISFAKRNVDIMETVIPKMYKGNHTPSGINIRIYLQIFLQ